MTSGRGSRRRARLPLVRIVDGALPADLFRRLARGVRALGTEGLRSTYQTTFWFDLGEPGALPEEAILALHGRLGWPGRGAASGVEWWLSRMRTSDVGVDFHRDRDERRFQRTGVEIHPAFSSVLFLNRCRGGLLAVTAEPASEANPARAPGSARRGPGAALAQPAGRLRRGRDARGARRERRRPAWPPARGHAPAPRAHREWLGPAAGRRAALRRCRPVRCAGDPLTEVEDGDPSAWVYAIDGDVLTMKMWGGLYVATLDRVED